MERKMLKFIDFEKINFLLESFNNATGFVTAILDLDGNILSKSGWRQICTEFHRVNPETAKNCTISDTELSAKLSTGKKYHAYKCLNGLLDLAVPIIINDEHVANLFSGQFFYEKPDKEFFIKQAQKYKFDNKKYLEALEKVPVVSEEKVKNTMEFLLNVTHIISEMTQQRIEQIESNKILKEREEKFRTFVNTASDLMCITNKDGQLTDVNRAMVDVLDYSIEELKEMHIPNLLTKEALKNDFKPNWGKFIEDGKIKIETSFRTKNGNEIPGELKASAIYDSSGKIIGTRAVFIDLTKRKQTEEELVKHRENLEALIKARTSELEEKNKELESFNKVFIGRELKMVELKEKIKELESKLK